MGLVVRLVAFSAMWALAACGGRPSRRALHDASTDAPDASDGVRGDDGGASEGDAGFGDAGACATATVEAEVERLPVDIVWVVDNSTSMMPAIEAVRDGLDDFAALVAASGLDYRVILLSLKGRGILNRDGRRRYGICIPPPLAGDANCGDGPRFFHVDVDIRSTQQVEQVLGTLAQSHGYSEGESRGSAPWRDLLREEATKSFIFVSDDNSRTCDRPAGARCESSDPPLTVTSLEDFPGGGNPFNRYELGPGLLDDSYGGLFEGYVVHALYGWGSETDPEVKCRYSDGTEPPASGATYTALVERTGGVRARICDGPAAWRPFFDAVASAVTGAARIACDVPLPDPPPGERLDPDRVNVVLDEAGADTTFGRVDDAASCGDRMAWHYDDPVAPSRLSLCPRSCDRVREALRMGGRLDVRFGCATVLY